MKTINKSIAVILLITLVIISTTSCLGSFGLFKKVQKWNGTLGDKWINSVIHAVLWIVPVYEICLLADLLVLNTLEFWQGKSPLEMEPDEKETQKVSINNDVYIITASRNRFDIEKIEGTNSGQKASLFYNDKNKTWHLASSSGTYIVLQETPGSSDILRVFYPGGESEEMSIQDMH